MKNVHWIAEKMMRAALQAVDPYRLISDQTQIQGTLLTVQNKQFDLNDFEHIYVVGAGKACAPMAQALEALLGDRITAGTVVVKYNHSKPTRIIRILEAGHPIPDENTIQGTRQIAELAVRAGANDLVIVLLSGGGSALMEWLPEEISLNDLQKTNQSLLACGADIEEINTIRKHLSLIKGGQLAKQIYPATGLTLILSDVIGDPLPIIASGPTVADDSTFSEAIDILNRYDLSNRIPESVQKYLQAGAKGLRPETPKAGDPLFRKMNNLILGNNLLALQKAAEVARTDGLQTLIVTDRVQGEVREIAKLLAGIFSAALNHGNPVAAPGCLIFGGEPTVTLKGNGKGGRNQEMALAMLRAMQKETNRSFYFCSLGTDGTDGPTEAAGAWIDHTTVQKARARHLSIDAYLNNNDSYRFFRQIDQLIITGPTGTNVMDLLIFLF